MNASNVPTILNQIVHNGLHTYDSSSKRKTVAFADTSDKKGAVFVVEKKTDFANGRVKGRVVKSKERLLEACEHVTHWTPNIFQKYRYDESSTYISGFEERNLSQVNAFIVDIDTKRYSLEMIKLACIDESVGEPSLILSTPSGYQVYFFLQQPLFISKENEFRSLKVAKRIAQNIKYSLTSVEADSYCNSFGFFRMPHAENICWYQDVCYTVHELIQWSMRQSDDLNQQLYVVPRQITTANLLKADWFQALLSTTDVKGQKGKIGRNNTIFTLALVCFQEGKEQEDTYNLLDQYNSNLSYSLKNKEIRSIIRSAYSGKYKGAKKEYVEKLLEMYLGVNQPHKVQMGSVYWYKHKKERKDRVRSHYHEWENDIIGYLTKVQEEDSPFTWMTRKELSATIGMAESSLNEVLKKSTKLLKTVSGKGRKAKTGWTTVGLFVMHILKRQQEQKATYRVGVVELLKSHLTLLEPVMGYEEVRRIITRRELNPVVQLIIESAFYATG